MVSKKNTPLKRKYVKKDAHKINQLEAQPFEIETAPPNYRLNPDLANTLNRIEHTVKILLPGQAFIVPSKSKHTIKKFLDEKWPFYKFMYSIIKDNPGMMRIYFLKRLDKK